MLADRYRLDEVIATGGMGQVWRATDETLRALVPKLKLARYPKEATILSTGSGPIDGTWIVPSAHARSSATWTVANSPNPTV